MLSGRGGWRKGTARDHGGHARGQHDRRVRRNRDGLDRHSTTSQAQATYTDLVAPAEAQLNTQHIKGTVGATLKPGDG